MHDLRGIDRQRSGSRLRKTLSQAKHSESCHKSEASNPKSIHGRNKSYRSPRVILSRMSEPAYTTAAAMLAVAIDEARTGLTEGGIPIGAAIFRADGTLVSRGRNRRVQQDDPSIHGETDAFRRAGRQRSYRDLILVTTLAPCWYCSGLVRQFGFRKLIVGESRTFQGGIDWLRGLGIEVTDLNSQECADLLNGFITAHPEIWNEDIGVD
jgi:cytosine deaminase